MTNPMTFNDAELLRLLWAGDEQAFTAFYRRHQGGIYRFALLMSGQASLAEEATQEVFLALLRQSGRYDPVRGALSAYLYGVARNQVLRLLERERLYVQLVEETDDGEVMPLELLKAGDDPLSDYTRNEAIKLVRQAVLALPPRYREVVVLCDFQELSHADAAVALDCPLGTVNSRLYRGHILLLQKLRAVGRPEAATSTAQTTRCFA